MLEQIFSMIFTTSFGYSIIRITSPILFAALAAVVAEKAGVTPDMSVSDICEAMKTAMTEITFDGLTGEGMTWSADGEPAKAPKAMKIVDGAYTAM